MQIAFALYDYYPFGGLQKDCLSVALEADRRGHEVHVFTRSWKGARPEGLGIHILGKRGWSNTARNEYFFKDLEAALAARSFDALVAFNRIPGADIYFAADPCYRARIGAWPLWKRLLPRHRYYLNLERRVFAERPPHTLALTRREIDAFRRHYSVPEGRLHLLPPGIRRVGHDPDAPRTDRESLRRESGTAPGAVVALFVGSGFRIKGLDRAIRAIATAQAGSPGLKFWVVGQGKTGPYRRLAERLGATVRFFGGRDDVDRFYRAADFLLHPAHSESAGKVLLEALTHGLPVLVTDTCGYAPHVERSGGGRVIPGSPFEHATLTDGVKNLATDPAARERMRQNAFRYASEEDLYSCHEAAVDRIEAIATSHSRHENSG